MSAHGAGKAYAIGLMMGLMSKGLTYNKEAAPNLNRWLDERLSFKSRFEK